MSSMRVTESIRKLRQSFNMNTSELVLWLLYSFGSLFTLVGLFFPIYEIRTQSGDRLYTEGFFIAKSFGISQSLQGSAAFNVSRLHVVVILLTLILSQVLWIFDAKHGKRVVPIASRLITSLLLLVPLVYQVIPPTVSDINVSREIVSTSYEIVSFPNMFFRLVDTAWTQAVYPYQVLLRMGFFLIMLGMLLLIVAITIDLGRTILRKYES